MFLTHMTTPNMKVYKSLTLSRRCEQMSCWCWRPLWSSSSSWWACLASCIVKRALASSSSWSRCHCWATTLSCAWVKCCQSNLCPCSIWKNNIEGDGIVCTLDDTQRYCYCGSNGIRTAGLCSCSKLMTCKQKTTNTSTWYTVYNNGCRAIEKKSLSDLAPLVYKMVPLSRLWNVLKENSSFLLEGCL